ncbi:MAG: ArdC family protein, partial [Gammaproteobacteria bacterium]
MSNERRDIHQQITDQIITAIEAGAGEFCLPWHRPKGSLTRPTNIASGNAYQGVNVLTLWVAAEAKGFPAGLWGTYRQWQAKGAQVRKGEKASLVVFYKELDVQREDAATGETTDSRVLLARASPVFNVAQVDGYALPDAAPPPPSSFDVVARAEALMRNSGALIYEGGDRAFYRPVDDSVHLPDRGRFTGTDTMSAQEAFYATSFHELTHWTGAKHRLDRAFGNRFGSRAYAFEELVA